MTGFFERLVGDRQAATGEIRPLIPSRFEPFAVESAAPAVSEAPLNSAEVAPLDALPAETSKASRVSQSAPTAPFAAEFDTRMLAGRPDQIAMSPRVEPPTATAPQPLPIELAKSPASPTEPPRHSDLDLLNRIRLLGDELRTLHGEPSPVGALAPIYVEARNEAQRVAEKSAVEMPMVGKTPTPTPQIVPESFPSLGNGVKAAPTVNVTIGRIEVRGVKSQEPPPARREPSARIMSLEQYLQRRAAGGGR